MSDPICVDTAKAGCGEGPLWDVRQQCLWWVDIAGRTLHRFEPANAATHRIALPILCSALVIDAEGALLVATEKGIGRLDSESGHIDLLRDPEPAVVGNRLNDMVVSPDGEVWAGTMSEGGIAATGALYRYGQGTFSTMMSDTTISNGLDFSHDGERLYFIDSVPRRLHVYEKGQWRVLRTFEPSEGKPDGLAVDSQGTLWIAMCDRGRVVSLSADGKLQDDEIVLPCDIVTSCAFGGEDMRTLYITTGTFSMSEDEKLANPLAGGLFSVSMDVPGRASFAAKWP